MGTRRTIAHMQHQRMSSKPTVNGYFYKKENIWTPVTNGEALQAATEIGMGLWSLGIRYGDRVAVMSNSRPEWDLIDNGALNIGTAVVSIYPTSTQDAVTYILNHSGSRVVFLENVDHWHMVASELGSLDDLQHVVVIDSTDMPPGDWIDLDKLREMGTAQLKAEPDLPDTVRNRVQPNDLASLMYTSGTTGRPKGVALTHEMLYSVVEILASFNILQAGDTGVIYLPMSHILQRVNVYAGRFIGLIAYFAPSILDFVETCHAANPSSMSGVPRVFEKIHARIIAGMEQAPPARQKIFNRAINIGRRRGAIRRSGPIDTIWPQITVATI